MLQLILGLMIGFFIGTIFTAILIGGNKDDK